MVFETAVAWSIAHPVYAAVIGYLATIFTTEVLRSTVIYVVYSGPQNLDPSRLIGYDVSQNQIKTIEDQLPLIVEKNERGDLVLTRDQVTGVVKSQLGLTEKRLSESEGLLRALQIQQEEMKTDYDKVNEEMTTLKEDNKLQKDQMVMQVESHVSLTLTEYLIKEGISEKIKFIHTRLDKLEADTGTISKQYKELEGQLKSSSNNVTKEITALKTEVSMLKKDLQDLKLDHNVKIKKINDENSFLQEQVQKLKSDMEEFFKKTSKETERLRQELSLRNIKTSSELDEIRSVMREHGDKNDRKLNEIRQLMTERFGEVQRVLTDHGVKVEFKDQTEMWDFTSIGIMSLIFILFAVIFVMIRLIHCERLLRRNIEATREFMSEIHTRTEGWASPQSAVIEKSKTITLASFQAGTAQTSHKQMAESVIKRKEVKELLCEGGGTLDVKQVLVNTAADIEKIVTSLVILVFIDHNDAMKILEDPNSKIEKVKTKTVEAAMEKSDTVIIVYCWDTKSKDLDLGMLYSPRLENSLSHPLLLDLRKQQSIYSIYKNFTYFQHCHLIKKLQSSLREPGKEVVLVPRNQNLQVQTSTSQNIRRRNQSS